MPNNSELFSKPGVTGVFKDANYWRSDEEAIFAHIPPLSRILVGGVGGGRTIPFITAKGHSIVAVDISPEMVAIVKEKFPGLDVRVMDLQRTSFDSKEFGAIFLPFHTIAYVDDLLITLCEMHRILKKDGVLIFNIPNRFFIKRVFDGFPAVAHIPITRGSADVFSTHTASYLSARTFKKLFSSVQVYSRTKLQQNIPSNWKEKLFHTFPFFDKSLYFVCKA